jgi:hypothetical protein
VKASLIRNGAGDYVARINGRNHYLPPGITQLAAERQLAKLVAWKEGSHARRLDRRLARKASRSGTSQSEATRTARGEGRLTLRMPLKALLELEVLANRRGVSRSELVAELVASAARRGGK